MPKKNDIDKIDRKIIQMLTKNARVTVKEIASEVFLSSPSVCARIAKLERDGIISGYTVVLNNENLGFQVHAFVQVDVKIMDKEKFFEDIRHNECIINCYNTAGEYSEMLEVKAENMHGLEKLLAKFQVYGDIKTNIIFSKLQM
ncbi:MAG: Lrp/AsnC family transcriptional regulator [Clostridia bacterium]